MKANTKNGQSLFDFTIEHTGSIAKLFEMSVKNGVGITDDIDTNTELELTAVDKQKNATLFGNLLSKPATALSSADWRTYYSEISENGIFDDTFDYTFN